MLHSYEIAPNLSGQPKGKEICCVGSPVCIDNLKGRHLLVTVPDGEHFIYGGTLPEGKLSYSFIRVVVTVKQTPAVLGETDSTFVLAHDACNWGGVRKVLELCSGLGAMGHGALAAGFTPTAGCDLRHKMCNLFERHSGAPAIHGDICEVATLQKLFQVFPHCGTVAAGIACQPYSVLGDGRSGSDPRASTLPATLAISYYLRAVLIIIECVGPAKEDPFVNHHINMFCKKTRFFRADCVMDLHEVWPSRRNRWWCILSAPAIGSVSISACTGFLDLPSVEHVLPSLRKWPIPDEKELELSPVELEAFGVGDTTGNSYLLNRKGPMPCALHCWGSQLTPCPCGCRNQQLSPARLAAKGLYGVLVESVATGKVRHLHPQEASALCGLDPVLMWGPECRLALGAVGQLASPVQSVWVFAHALKALEVAQWQRSFVDPSMTVMAYRTWLLARCRYLLRDTDTRFPASEALAHVRVFEKHIELTMHEMLGCVKGKIYAPTLQDCWEAFTAQNANVSPAIEHAHGPSCVHTPTSVVPTEVASEVGDFHHGLTVSQVAIDPDDLSSNTDDVECLDESRTFVAPFQLATPDAETVCLQILQCGEVDEPVRLKIHGQPTVEQLQTAECEIRGFKRKAEHVFEDGLEVCSTHPIQVGSLYLLDFGHEISPLTHAGFISSSEVSESPHATETSAGTDFHRNSEQLVPPTVDSFGKLNGAGFLCLHNPVVSSIEQANSLLEQRNSVASRLLSLQQQGPIWGDDEIRWHLYRVQAMCREASKVFVIEPLLLHGCFATLNFRPLARWIAVNHSMNSSYIAVVLHEKHWYPVHVSIGWEGIKATTWDVPGFTHVGLEAFVTCVAETLNLPVHSIFQLERRFSASSFCGALSIAFLENRLLQIVLPETTQLADAHHTHLRQLFVDAVSSAEITWRPWIWGEGVGDPTFDQAVDSLTPLLVSHGVPSDNAHHRAQQAVKAIGVQDVMRACQGKSPWKSLKVLGTNVRFQFISKEELQAQIDKRAGKGPVGKPVKKNKQLVVADSSSPVALDPAKLGLPDEYFTGGGKGLQQIPFTMVGPVAEGVVIVSPQQAEPYLRASRVIAQGPLAFLILQSPIGSVGTTLRVEHITVPARCLVNQEPLLLEVMLVQLGAVHVSKSQVESPVAIDTVQVSTVKLTVFRDECLESWEIFSGAPLKYIIKTIPLLRICRGENCGCPCWHNFEKINTSDAIIDVWRRQFLRAGYKPEPVSSAVIFSVCIRIPQCLLLRILGCSGEGGVYAEPRSMDSREVSRDFEVIWVPRSDKAAVSHIRQTNPATLGLARLGERFGVRVITSQAAELHRLLRPDAVYLATGVRQQYIVGPIPFGTDRKALSRALSLLPWSVKPLQPVSALDGQRGVMWSVVAVDEPPTNIINMSHGEVLITKQKDNPSPKDPVKQPVGTPSTLSLCGTDSKRGPDPWTKLDPWGGYAGFKSSDNHGAGLATAAESIHQLEHKIEQAVLSKIPQTFSMDQDDMPDKLQDLESKVQSLLTRQQQLEGIVQEQSVQTTAQFGQMQAQLNAHGQQISGHMESQQQQIQMMFESQMSQIRSLLTKRKCDSEHE